MKIVRWFLSHFFLILLIVLVIYGYMFWGNLAGEKTPAGKALAYLSSEFVEVEEFINAVKAKQAQLSAQQTPLEQVSAEKQPDQSENKSDEQPVAPVAVVPAADKKIATARNIAQQPVSISYSHNQMRVKQNSTGQIESRAEVPTRSETTASVEKPASIALETPVAAPLAKPEAAAPVKTEAAPMAHAPAVRETPPQRITVEAEPADKFVSPQLEQQLNNVDKNGKVINPVLKGDAIRESWVTARKSFYQRKYELSEQSYRDVISNTTDNFDAYGELGNVYFNQGKNTDAAEAYFEAAAILVRKGQVGRARSLMGLLRHLDKTRAADLQKLIDAAAS